LVRFFSINLNISPGRSKPMLTTATPNAHCSATAPVVFIAGIGGIYVGVRFF
jgi:hypothetical protein